MDIPLFLQSMKPMIPLSSGEQEVVALLSQGLDVSTMATHLDTSLDVIRRRLSDIYKKLNVEGPAGPNGKLNELKRRLAQWESETQRQQLELISPTYGRESDLTTLQKWLKEEGCHLLAIQGVQGIGKTALAAALFQQLQQAQIYEKYFWLSPCPPFTQLSEQLLKSFEWNIDPEDLQKPHLQLARLVDYFRLRRCLLVIDQAEMMLEPQQTVGQYREGYELYAEFFKHIGEQSHQSAVVLTSLERLPIIESLEIPAPLSTVQEGEADSVTQPVRSWQLTSLPGPAVLKIIEKYVQILPEDEAAWLKFADLYQGNPASIKMAASFICEFFNGNVADFLEQNALVFGDFSSLIAQQLERLSTSELEMVKCLALEEEGMTLVELGNHMNCSKQMVMTSIQSLRRRSFLTRTVHNDQVVFTLPPLICEYARQNVVELLGLPT